MHQILMMKKNSLYSLTHYLIMGGNFNCLLNLSLDRSSTKPIQTSKTTIAL